MKAVLLSIDPKWCELIASGKKTIEVRKTRPKIYPPFKCYIYETKGKTETPFVDEDGHMDFHGRGQVIGEFVCNYITPFRAKGLVCDEEIVTKSCISLGELIKYTPDKPFPKDHIYAWHISDLVIYDKPKELRKFHSPCNSECIGMCQYGCLRVIKRPPQSWCYVEEEEG